MINAITATIYSTGCFVLPQTIHMTTSKPSRIFKPGAAATLFLTIPAAIASDSKFPFDDDAPAKVEIEGETLRVSRIEES